MAGGAEIAGEDILVSEASGQQLRAIGSAKI